MTSRIQRIGQITRPGSKPQNFNITDRVVPVLTESERAAGLTWVNGDYEPGDVRRYGAVIDGVTDDTGAVSDWLDVGMQGVPLTHDSGIALCSSWTQKDITADISISGAGTIKGDGSDNFIKPAGGSFISDGVEYDTWLSLVKNAVADSGTTPTLEFHNCVIRNCSANGFDHERPIDRFVLDNVRMYGMSNYAVRIGRNVYAEQDNWQNLIVDNVYIEDSTATGSTDASGMILYGRDAQISNLHIGTITSASGACWGLYTKVRYAQISNILIDDISTTSGADVAALNIKGALKGATSSPQGFTYIVDGVTVKNTDGIGLKIQQEYVHASNIHIEEFGTDGITIDDADSDNIILNGFIVTTDTAGTKVAVRVSKDGKNTTVTNGIMQGASIGLRVASPAGGGEGYTFTSLRAIGCTTGFQINTSNALDSLTYRDCFADSGCTSGFITSGSGTVTRLRVFDSDFSDASTPATIGGTLTAPKFIRVNGYVTENQGTANISTGNTVSHGLSSTPDRVFLSAGNNGITAMSATSLASSTFVLNHDGGGTETVYWRAIMDEAF